MDETINLKLSEMQELGENILAKKSGNKIIIVIDADTRLGLSQSGKTTIVATTRGNVPFSGLTFGLNIYTKR